MQDLNDLYYFVQVVDSRGFAPAGRALNMPKSKLSRRVAALEERLGVRLLQRSTRQFTVTEVGQDYYRHCVAMLVEANAAQETIDRQRAEPQGIVRLSCPPALLDYQVGQLMGQFMVAFPRVQVQLESTGRRVDVIGEGFDVALRVRFPPLEDTDLVMRVLGESTQRLVTSPALLLQHQRSAPLQPQALSGLPSLDEGPPHRRHVWALLGPGGVVQEIEHHPRLVTDDRQALRQAALQGVGVVQLPTMMVWRDLQQGALVDLTPDWRPRAGVVHAVFPSRRGLLPAVRELIEFLARGFPDFAQTEQSGEPLAAHLAAPRTADVAPRDEGRVAR